MSKSSLIGIVGSFIGILLMQEACASGFASRLRYHRNWPSHLEHICGDNNAERISGGRTAALGQFPWMARLIVNATLRNGKMHINCGGTLITERHVVSAAHCIEQYHPLAVVLGEWDTGHDPDCGEDYCADNIETIPIEKYFFPKEYVEGDYKRHDILLLKLIRPVVITEWIMPICLPTGSEKFPNFGEVAGWGHTSRAGQTSKKLKYVQVCGFYEATEHSMRFKFDKGASDCLLLENSTVQLQFAPIQSCEDAIGFPFDERIQFCAGSLTKDDACVGDSGGPWMQLASTDNGPRYYLTGVVSMGPEGCGAGIGVYTRMDAHMTYILDRLN